MYKLAGEGATVVSCYSNPKASLGVAVEVTEDIVQHGGKVHFVRANLADSEGFEMFAGRVKDEVNRTGRPLSFFSPNAAGGAGFGQTPEYARTLDFDTPLKQIVDFAPFMKGGVVVVPQSEPAHRLDNEAFPEFSTEALDADRFGKMYRKIADPKHALEVAVSNIAPQLADGDVSVRFVVANAVRGTRLFRMLISAAKGQNSDERIRGLIARSPDGVLPTHLDVAEAMVRTKFDGLPSTTVTYVGLGHS